MQDLSTKEQIRVLYNAGQEAVITLVQGLFDKISHFKQLVESHMAGENHVTRLAILLTLELWHRQFID